MGEIMVAPSDLVLAFGKPGDSDEYKVSGEWTFHDKQNDIVFTLYDWKCTSLYESGYPSPEELWATTTPVYINIGGDHKGNVEEFKAMIRTHIEWVKTGKPFEEQVLELSAPALFLPGKAE